MRSPFDEDHNELKTAIKQLPPPQKGCARTHTHTKPKHELGTSSSHLLREALQEAIPVSRPSPVEQHERSVPLIM